MFAWLRRNLIDCLASNRADRGRSALAARRLRTTLQCEALEDRFMPTVTIGPNINISQSSASDAETAIAVNPTNTKNLFVTCTATAVFKFSNDGGASWQDSNVGSLSSSNGDQQLAWDQFGNLFMVTFGSNGSTVLALSSDGGATFTNLVTTADNTDQPSVAVGAGMVWFDFNLSGTMNAQGAAVTGLGAVGAFSSVQQPGGSGGTFGDIAISPNGQVMLVYQENNGNGTPSNVFISVDPDGLGSQGFSSSTQIFVSNIGSFDAIPAQPDRTIDAEVNLAWDKSNGPHRGRVYLVNTDELVDESSDTDIFVRFSDDNGTTWSTPVRVNDDPSGSGTSQFQGEIALDQSNGDVAVTWYDCRNSSTNTTSQVFGSVSHDGGLTWEKNFQISTGVIDATTSGAGTFNYGDYDKMDFAKGVFYRSWADNSNSTSDNPAGALGALDIYTAQVTVLPSTPGGPGGGGGGGIGGTVRLFNPVRFRQRQRTPIYAGFMSIVNYSGSAVDGPIFVIFKKLPAGAVVLNASGTTADGKSFIKLNRGLNPRKFFTFHVRVSNPSKKQLDNFFQTRHLKFTTIDPTA
jgi:hypothetical protein